MKSYEFENIRIEGYRGTWHEIDRTYINNELYIFFEHETYGDETEHLLCKIPPIQNLTIDAKGRIQLPGKYVVYESWDDMETALDEAGIEEPENLQGDALKEEIEQLRIVASRIEEIAQKWKE